MAKPYKIPDFRKMYPEASEEVIAVLRTSERKMQYQEYDLKRARNIVDPKTGEKMTILAERIPMNACRKWLCNFQKKTEVLRIRF